MGSLNRLWESASLLSRNGRKVNGNRNVEKEEAHGIPGFLFRGEGLWLLTFEAILGHYSSTFIPGELCLTGPLRVTIRRFFIFA
jgi:hypothetical protein